MLLCFCAVLRNLLSGLHTAGLVVYVIVSLVLCLAKVRSWWVALDGGLVLLWWWHEGGPCGSFPSLIFLIRQRGYLFWVAVNEFWFDIQDDSCTTDCLKWQRYLTIGKWFRRLIGYHSVLVDGIEFLNTEILKTAS